MKISYYIILVKRTFSSSVIYKWMLFISESNHQKNVEITESAPDSTTEQPTTEQLIEVNQTLLSTVTLDQRFW